MECPVCGGGNFTSVFNKMVCNRCGAIMEDKEVVDFDINRLYNFINKLLERLEEDKREFFRGAFVVYIDTLEFSKWKKAREWARLKIIDLIQKLMKL